MSDFNPHQFRDEVAGDIRRRMRSRRDRYYRRHSGPQGVIIGMAILLMGVLFLLENFAVLHIQRAWDYWPVVLIAWGIAGATNSGRPRRRVWGGVVAIVGTLLLLGNLHIITEDIWRYVWPLLLIGAGLRMLFRSGRRRRWPGDDNFPPAGGSPITPEGTTPLNGPPGAGSRPGHLDEWAVFGGSRRRVDSQDFKGGETFAMFGGVELDLRSASITQDEVVIDANALFGGVDIQVPENWNVAVEGHGIFGGYEDKTLHAMSENARPRVVITGSAVFGGVVVKN